MRVIICGAGRVGFGIATRLSSEKNTVTVVDLDADLVRKITTDLDVRGVVGHGAHPDVLHDDDHVGHHGQQPPPRTQISP